MPWFLISIAIQLAAVVHIIKTGRNTFWIYIVIFAPVVGTMAYAIVELLPELTQSRTGRSAKTKFVNIINPQKNLRAAEERYAVTNTVKNAMLLAEQYLHHDRVADAKALYQRCLTGIYADDPHLLLGLATAHYALAEYAEALRCLDQLKARNPQSTSEDGHLLYANCLQGLGKTTEAIHEYEALARYYPGPEPACRLALLLKLTGQREKANAIFADIVNRARRSGRHYRSLHQEWITVAKQELQ
ncbi:MAG TPA: tetratricopeptide repeat protein [Candidatus Acidoferrum sp.]|nr:tetratricopeptide repeat protein [Candidatus Acidoferrum sp.]